MNGIMGDAPHNPVHAAIKNVYILKAYLPDAGVTSYFRRLISDIILYPFSHIPCPEPLKKL